MNRQLSMALEQRNIDQFEELISEIESKMSNLARSIENAIRMAGNINFKWEKSDEDELSANMSDLQGLQWFDAFQANEVKQVKKHIE